MIRYSHLTALAAVAAVLMAITAALYSTKTETVAGFYAGMPLIQGLAPERVHSIVIARGSQTVTLTRSELEHDTFLLAESNNYPADPRLVNQLFVTALAIRCKEKVTESSANYQSLGVDDGSVDKFSLIFRDADGNTLTGLLRGKGREQGGGCFVRLIGDPTVYAAETFANFETIPMKYLDTRVLATRKEEVRRVEVAAGENRLLVRRDDAGNLIIDGIPEGKRVKHRAVDDVVSYAANLNFINAESFENLKDVQWDVTCVTELNSGLVYTTRYGKKGAKCYVRIEAAAPPQAFTVRPDESQEELKRKEAMLLAYDTATAFNRKHGDWAYQVETWGVDRLRRPPADLMEDIPAPGEEIECSHILITWKGALRADENISRDKEAALLLANEVLSRAKAPGADFAQLARRYSDDIDVRIRGQSGEMGPVRKGAMDPRFEKLAFALEPGQIANEPAETRLGYHVIKRTK